MPANLPEAPAANINADWSAITSFRLLCFRSPIFLGNGLSLRLGCIELDTAGDRISARDGSALECAVPSACRSPAKQTKHIGSRALLIAIKIAEFLRRRARRGQALASVATIAKRRKNILETSGAVPARTLIAAAMISWAVWTGP
jgi:hypothetical protein